MAAAKLSLTHGLEDEVDVLVILCLDNIEQLDDIWMFSKFLQRVETQLSKSCVLLVNHKKVHEPWPKYWPKIHLWIYN